MFYVYIVQCRDNTYYTGYTNNINKRIKMHNEGKGSKYTRARLPVKLVYTEIFNNKNEALRREFEIKKLNRKQKHSLVTAYLSESNLHK